jgi:hypothetical protein
MNFLIFIIEMANHLQGDPLGTFQDRQVLTLFNLARDADESLISHDQKVAIELLGSLARGGNREARTALLLLLKSPDLHPLLREVVASVSGLPLTAGTQG